MRSMPSLTGHSCLLCSYMLFGSCTSVLMALHPFSKRVIYQYLLCDQILRRAKGNAIADHTCFVRRVAATVRLS
jgi:hypothetical protein